MKVTINFDECQNSQVVLITYRFEGRIYFNRRVHMPNPVLVPPYRVNTREIVVYGTVNGKVKAESIDIKSSGKILGEIQTKTFQVERGAIYTGMVSMAKESSIEHLVAVK